MTARGLSYRARSRRWILAAIALLVPVAMAVSPGPSAVGATKVLATIAPQDFDAAASRWDTYGPLFEANPAIAGLGATHTHAYGALVGKLVYRFRLAEVPRGATFVVRARLSSEHVGYTAPAEWRSDVRLVVNGEGFGSKRVIADDGSGAGYRWFVPSSAFKVGGNTLAFAVPPGARYRNGLCIYQDALVPGEYDAGIVVAIA